MFLIKLRAAGLQLEKETPAQVFSYEFYEIFRNTVFIEHLRVTASNQWTQLFQTQLSNTYTQHSYEVFS